MNWEYVIAAVIIALLIPLIKRGWEYLGLKTKDTKWANFYNEVSRVVSGVEQMYKNGDLSDRLTAATNLLQDWLNANGLKLDANKLRTYIESEVGYLPPTNGSM